jgi:hypothetical protein
LMKSRFSYCFVRVCMIIVEVFDFMIDHTKLHGIADPVADLYFAHRPQQRIRY